MKIQLIIFILSVFPLLTNAQGYGYVLFSSKGDTVLTRTSFGEIDKKDTITTYFVVYEKGNNKLNRLSVFTVDEKKTEKHSKGYACADYRLVPIDTISKYDFKYVGVLINPKHTSIKIKVKTEQILDTIINGERMFRRQIEYTFVINGRTFLTETVWDIVNKRYKAKEKPRITKIYYNELIDRYFLEYMLVDNYFDKETKRVITRNTRKEIII